MSATATITPIPMTAKEDGFTTGTFMIGGATGPSTLQGVPNKNYAIVEIDGTWNEAIGQASIKAGVAEMNSMLQGQGTITQHVNSFLGMFGAIPANILAEVESLAAGADKLIGQKISLTNATPVVMSVLAAAGVISSAAMPEVSVAVAGVTALYNALKPAAATAAPAA